MPPEEVIITEEQKLFVRENVKKAYYNVQEAKEKYRSERPVRIMAVTKTVSPELVNIAVSEGITLLGENRVQEYLSKKEFYDKKAEVHFIGSLQKNKAKYIVGDIPCIHSVDSASLCSLVNTISEKRNAVTDVLIEVNIGEESSKGGVNVNELDELADLIYDMKNVRLKGLMAIPPVNKSEECFEKMRILSEDFKNKYKGADLLSMGMSADYVTAIKYGSDIVRLGSALFGARKYKY